MRKLLSIILGVIIFMAPLQVFAFTGVNDVNDDALDKVVAKVGTLYPGEDFTVFYYEIKTTSGTDYESGFLACVGTSSLSFQTLPGNSTKNTFWSDTLSAPAAGAKIAHPVGYAWDTNAVELYQSSYTKTAYQIERIATYITKASYNAGGNPIDPYAPPVNNYTIPVGSTARFSLNEGQQSESLTVHANGDTATVTIKTVNPSNASTTSQYTVSDTLVSGCTKYNEVTINSSGTTNPEKQWVVISSTMPMQIIGTGGVINDPSTEQGYLGASPDTVTFMNRTGHTQYIRMTRTTAGDGQYTIATWSQLSGGNYALVGSLPFVKDTTARNLPIKNGQNLQIYNHGGSTRYEYPVLEGLSFVLSTRGGTYGDTESPNLGIGEVQLGESPDIQTPVPDPTEYPTTIGGFMQWIGDTVNGMFSNILQSLQSVVTTVTGFSGQVGQLGNIMGDFLGLPAWMVGLITLGITLPIIAGIICRRLL